MPDLNLNQQTSDSNQQTFVSDVENAQSSFAPGISVPPPIYQKDEVRTYNDEEITDPKVIDVSLPGGRTPIVVLFGPPQSGKTMTMIRMAEYLSDPIRGYTVAPVNTFRADFDTNYAKNCKEFNSIIGSKWAAKKSEGLDFMLLTVSKGGKPIVHILEAPGEHYYDPDDLSEPKESFLPYIRKVIQSQHKKIWVYLVEPSWKNESHRKNYAKKVDVMRTKMKISKKDDSIILFNKVDQTSLFGEYGVNIKEAENMVDGLYPGLFQCFKNTHPITSLWKHYRCTFVPFVTGQYEEVTINGIKTKRYEPGDDSYPEHLWAVINKIVRG